MRIDAAPYVLRSLSPSLSARTQGSERSGALLRVSDAQSEGYADLHPWPELGDEPLGIQLAKLSRAESTPLIERALAHAAIDAQARAAGVSLFDDLEIPPSHFLVSDLQRFEPKAAEGFDCLKIKIGRDLKTELPLLSRLEGFRLRLDLNALGTPRDLLELPWPKNIEFIEDPVPAGDWRELHMRTGLPLARDREASEGGFQWWIVKPAIQKPEAIFHEASARATRVCVTSYLDHPLGQVTAAYFAARERALRPSLIGDCGLVSHLSYERTDFSEVFGPTRPVLRAPGGTGFGFDDLLQRQNWECIR